MRILHTEWSDDLGGQEKRVLAESTGFVKRGHYVSIVCREEARINEEARKAGIHTHTLPLRSPYDLESILALKKILRKSEIDVINTHSGKDSWIGALAAKLAGTPVLARTRHLNIPLRRTILNFVHYLPDVYITCGENMRRTLVESCGFPGDKVVSIPTGVGLEFFEVKRSALPRAKYGLSDDNAVISNVGVLRSVKGQEVTLKAVKKVVASYPMARFLFVGDGPGRRRLTLLAEELGVAKYVSFTGYVKDVPEIFSFTDVSVLSSHSEGIPQSLLQAMAAGVPVVATNVGGVPEVITHEQTGLIVPPADHEALADGIIRILRNPTIAASFGAKAKDFIMGRHSSGAMLDRIENLYMELLGRKKVSATR